MAIGGDYYNPNDKIVYDGNTAEAADLNAINTAVDTAFETVSADIVTVDNKITGVSDDAEKWATDPQGTNPDPLQPTEYSSFANAQEAKAWASGTGGVDTEADGTTVIPYSANEKATAAANSASAADTSATNAATSESNAATSESNAATSASNAATSETNAGTSETNAAASETKASEWADKAEDSPVETGPDRYSAFHWAQKAAAEVVDAVQQTSDTGSAIMPKGTTAQRDGTPLSGYLRFNTEDTTFEGYDGTEWGPIGGGGGLDWTTAVTNSSFTAEDGKGYKVDTRVAGVTVTLPATPTEGMRVAIKDDYGTFDTFNCTIDRNGSEIEGNASDYIMDQEGQYLELTYGASNGWVITATSPTVYVQNKPFMHVAERYATGTEVGTSSGDNTRALNSVVYNDISGASLATNLITLPAGTYYIEASATSNASGGNRLSIWTSTDTVLLDGMSGYERDSTITNGLNTVKGRLTLASATDIKLNHYIGTADATDGMGNAVNDGQQEQYAEVMVWRLDDVLSAPISNSTKVGVSPLMFLTEEQANGVNAGASLTGDNFRLNTLKVNEIPGASWDGPTKVITLPAGTYRVHGSANAIYADAGDGSKIILEKSDGTTLIVGTGAGFSTSATVQAQARIHGSFTLSATTDIKFNHYWDNRNSGGAALGTASATSSGTEEIFAELWIEKIDTLVETPIISGNSLYPLPGNSFVTGNMFGLDYAKTGANQVTVEAGICMDSLNTTALDLPSSQAVSVGTTINQVYNLFLCDDQVVRTDTDVNGSSLSAYKIRWIGFVRNNSSGNICEFYQNGDHIAFAKASENIVSAAIAVTPATVDHSSFLPVSRIESIEYGTTGATASMTATLDGTDTAYQVGIATAATDTSKDSWGDANEQKASLKPFNSSMQFRVNTGTQDLLVHSVIVKR